MKQRMEEALTYFDTLKQLILDAPKASIARDSFEAFVEGGIEREKKLVEALQYYANAYCISKDANSNVHCKYTDDVARTTLKELGIS